MSCYRRGKLALDTFYCFTSKISFKTTLGHESSRLYHAGYLTRVTNNANFSGFSSGSSISQKRNFSIWHAIVRLTAMSYVRLTTVPYVNRSRLILKTEWEVLGLYPKEDKYKGKILPSDHPEYVRVRRITMEIIEAFLERCEPWNTMQESKVGVNWFYKLVQWSRKKIQERNLQVARSYFKKLNLELPVVNDPYLYASYTGGKIIIFTGMLKVFKSDAEIATIIGHEVWACCGSASC